MTQTRGAAILAVGAAVCLSATLTAETPWIEMRGKGFVLRGQVSTATLAAVACDLETAVKVNGGSPAAKNAPQVVAVDSARGIREWLPQFNQRGHGNPLGAYWRGLYGDHIVVRADAPPAERLRRVLHEYSHFVTHLSQPEPPSWLDEGLSELWEHAAISADTVEIGRPAAEHLKLLRTAKRWMTVQELLAANAIPTRTDSASAMFYAESWALVHYLMFEKRVGQSLVERLPADLPTDAALRAYVQGPMGAPITISIPARSDRCVDQTYINNDVSSFESLLNRGQALADGERPEAALPLLRAALLLHPDNAETLDAIGFVAFKGNRPAEAASVFDRVIAAGKGSYISYYYRAVLAGPVPEVSGGGGSVPQVEYLRKALALNPGFAPAVQRLRELTGGKRYLALQPQAVRK